MGRGPAVALTRARPWATLLAMTLEKFLDRLDRALRENPATHPARLAFELADEVAAELSFAGSDGEELGAADFETWWSKGGPDPFVDGEGRATFRVKPSHRITDWAVINARMTHTGLTVDKRYLMLRSWVTDV